MERGNRGGIFGRAVSPRPPNAIERLSMVGRPPRGRRTLARKLKSVCYLVGRSPRDRRAVGKSGAEIVATEPKMPNRHTPRPNRRRVWRPRLARGLSSSARLTHCCFLARFERKALLHANTPCSTRGCFLCFARPSPCGRTTPSSTPQAETKSGLPICPNFAENGVIEPFMRN